MTPCRQWHFNEAVDLLGYDDEVAKYSVGCHAAEVA
jgi:hypothetical protein